MWLTGALVRMLAKSDLCLKFLDRAMHHPVREMIGRPLPSRLLTPSHMGTWN